MENLEQKSGELEIKEEAKFIKKLIMPNCKVFINESLAIYKKEYKVLLALSLVLFLPMLATIFVKGEILKTIIGISSSILDLFVFISIALFIKFKVVEEKNLTIKEYFETAKKIIIPFVLLSLMQWAILVGAFSLLIIPGIIVAVLIAFSSYVFIFENRSGLDNVMRSRQLVLGNWWDVAVKLSLVGVIIFLLVPGALSGIISLFIKADSEIISTIVFGLIGILATPFWFLYSYSIYKFLAKEKNTEEPLLVGDHKKKLFIYKALLILGVVVVALMLITGAFFPEKKESKGFLNGYYQNSY